MAKYQILTKLTLDEILKGVNRKDHPNVSLASAKKHAQVFTTVYGRVTGFQAKSGDKGDYILYDGMFESIRTCDGQRAKATKMILPNLGGEALFNAYIASVPKKTDTTTGQEVPDLSKAQPFAFAFDLGAVPHATSSTGYKFTVAPVDIGDEEETDPLADIFAKVKPQLPQTAVLGLEGPKADDTDKGGDDTADQTGDDPAALTDQTGGGDNADQTGDEPAPEADKGKGGKK